MNPLRDHDAERAVLGSVLLMPGVLKPLLGRGLRPEHFDYPPHQAALAAMAAISDRDAEIDSLTLGAELELADYNTDGQALVHSLISTVPDAQNWPAYADRVKDLYRRRQLRFAATLIEKAAVTGDDTSIVQAEALLTTPDDQEVTSWTPAERVERYRERKNGRGEVVWPWPFHGLDTWTGGGLRRKQIVLIGGWTSNGKSIVYDQILHTMAGHGLRVHSYINEMSEDERTDRDVTRLSGIPFWQIQRRRIPASNLGDEEAALGQLRVGLTECAGWDAAEIARHIKWNRWDVAGVDIVHEIPHRDERDLAEIAQTLRAAAKQANCALVACVHLNDNRVTTPQRPAPVLRDVRGTGMLVRGADIVLLIHRDDNEQGIPTDDGMLFAAKIRGGSPNAMAVRFDSDRLRFLPKVGGA